MKSKSLFSCLLTVLSFSALMACTDNGSQFVPGGGDDPIGPIDPEEPEITVVDSTSTLVTKAAEFDYTAKYKAINVSKGFIIDKVEIGSEIFRPKQNYSHVMTAWLYVGEEDYGDKENNTLYLSVAENIEMEDRHAVVLLVNASDSLVFNVTQKGRTEPFLVFDERKDIELEASQAQLFQANVPFAVSFFKEVYAREDKQEVMVSPFCVESAMCMLANGAKGETYNQIINTLGYSGYSIAEVNAAYHALLTGLQNVDHSATLASANALWLDKVNYVLPEFQKTLRDQYDALVETLDFSKKEEALEHINAWGSEHTEGMIPEMLPRIEDSWEFILANALYFKGMWTEKFDKNKTFMEVFNCLSGEKRNMDFMHEELPCKYSYSYELEAALCELPFGNGAFVLDILLPEPENDFGKFIEALNAENWSNAIAGLQERKEIVVLPKLEFSFAGEESIVDALKAMGISLIFDTVNSDLSLICKPSAVIGTAFHNVSFKMDEDGAKAAATMILPGWVTDPGPSPEFIADHPFILAIREISTNTIIFFGAFKGV